MKKIYPNWSECLDLNEIKSLVGLRHPNIVTLRELILTNNNQLHLIFEYLDLNLYEYMTKQNRDIAETKIRNIIFQILQGLHYMHKQNFFHRDMKPENILINDDHVKIADFGLAKELNSKSNLTEYVATRWYRSPEVILKSKNYSSSIDIFALGAIMSELYNSRPLFPGKSEHEQINKICDVLGTPSDWSEGLQLANKIGYKFPSCKPQKLKSLIPRASDMALNLIQAMLNFEPNKRPTAGQCLQHPFFQCHQLLPVLIKLDSKNNMKTSSNEFFSSSLNERTSNYQNVKNPNNLSHSANNLGSINTTPIRVTKPSELTSKKKHTVHHSGSYVGNSTSGMNSTGLIGHKKFSLQPTLMRNNLEVLNSNSIQNK